MLRRLSQPCRAFSAQPTAPKLLQSRTGGLLEVHINRPKVLNALSLPVIRALRETLAPVNSGDAAVVCLQGAGGKAFCAGGDIKLMAGDLPLAPGKPRPKTSLGEPVQGQAQFDGQLSFFSEEYQVDTALAQSSRFKPWMAIWDGIVMGGGVGISIHLPVRVATENTVFAMPETGIGFFPDVGGSYWLSRMADPGVGEYLALAGARVKGAEALRLGIATNFVLSERLPELKAMLAELPAGSSVADVRAVVAEVQAGPGEQAAIAAASSAWEPTIAAVGATFSKCSVEGIIRELQDMESTATDEHTAKWAKKTLKTLARMSPTSLKVTLEQLARGKRLSRDDCYRMELHMAMNFMARPDFYEGVRALLVDKDNAPAWASASLADVSPDEVDAHFAPVEGVPTLQFLPTADLVDMGSLQFNTVARQ